MGLRIIGTGVSALFQLDAARCFVGVGTVNLDLAQISIHHVQFFRVGKVEHGVRRLEVVNGVDQLVRLQIKNKDFRVLFRGSEQAVALQVDDKVVEVSV